LAIQSFLGPVCQLGHVVSDIEAAMTYWTDIRRIGPFFCVEKPVMSNVYYAGKLTDVQISVAYSHLGNLQIELIQQRGDAPSPYVDFLSSGREGLHHLAFWTENYAADRRRLEEVGFQEVYAGRPDDPAGGFSYFSEPGQNATLLELTALTPRKRRTVDAIARAAESWDGRTKVHRFQTVADLARSSFVDPSH
jgi:hypothetical protein